MLESRGADVIVIGGGFSGSLVAANLVARDPDVTVVLLEGTRVPGRGVAYDTPDETHLLNVRAAKMSAFEDAPDHFVTWARSRGHAVDGATFASRRLYGAYLEDVLARARTAADGRLTLRTERATGVRRLSDGRYDVETNGARMLSTSAVVLALGHAPPTLPGIATPVSERVFLDPWAAGALDAVPVGDTVLLVGTGLTMVDVATRLVDRGARHLLAVSRRGLLPRNHRPAAVDPALDVLLTSFRSRVRTARTVRGLVRIVRETVTLAEQTTTGTFREVVDALRSSTPALWADLDPREKRRFIRHVRPYWESVRHRSAPRPAARIEALARDGTLHVVAARVVSAHGTPTGLDVALRRRGATGVDRVQAGALVVCTGASGAVARAGHGLVGTLIDQDLAAVDATAMGLRATADGALLDAADGVVPGLFAAGPLLRGAAYEATAVPELRVQAARVARAVAREVRDHDGIRSGVIRIDGSTLATRSGA